MDRDASQNSSSDEDQDMQEFGAIYQDAAAAGPLFSATSFDYYFAQTSKPSRTSANIFSAQTTPLSSHEYAAAISASLARVPPSALPEVDYRTAFSQYTSQLRQGFNLIFYGAGSKRRVLNSFAMHVHRTVTAHVLIINCTKPDLDHRDILSSIERITEVSSAPISPRGNFGQMARIATYFHSNANPRELYIIIHNIDAPSLRSRKANAILSWLCSNPKIHITASVDNIAFPVRTFLEGQNTRGEVAHFKTPTAYRWLWYDVPTLCSYDSELSWADRSSLHGASQAASTASRTRTDTNNSTTILSSEAARHVLLSVTQKAKKLFVMLGTRQLQSRDDSDASIEDSRGFGVEHSTLFNLARENFIATNDTSLRALMGEFRDHGLIVTSTQSSGMGDLVRIALRNRILADLVADIEQGRL